jgi:hypothetical protein
METLETMFTPSTLLVILFIAGLGLLASPYEIENDEKLE